MKYCRKEDSVFYQTVMTNTKTKTNTITKTTQDWVPRLGLDNSLFQSIAVYVWIGSSDSVWTINPTIPGTKQHHKEYSDI